MGLCPKQKLIHGFENESVSSSVMSDSLQPHGLQPSRLLCPWDSPGKNTGVGCHSLLQGIFLTQESNLGIPHCRQILYHLSHQESFGGSLFEKTSSAASAKPTCKCPWISTGSCPRARGLLLHTPTPSSVGTWPPEPSNRHPDTPSRGLLPWTPARE